MTVSGRRNRMFLAALALGWVALGVVSCGGSQTKKVPIPDDDAGAGGEPGTAGRGPEHSAGGGQAGRLEPMAAGASGDAAGAAGQAGSAGAPGAAGEGGANGQDDDGGASGAACDPPITGRITIAFDAMDAERITKLQWTNSAATLTANLIGEGGGKHCTDPNEFFGQSYGAPEGTSPGPVVGGHLASLLRCGADATIISAVSSCDATAPAQLPVTTAYHFYSDVRASELRVTRSFGFDATTPVYSGTTGLRPFVPRVLATLLPNVLYPNQAGTAVTSLVASNCGGDCITPTGTSWNGKWIADVDPASGLAMIVMRDPSLTSAVDLTVNYDAASGSNLASFVLVQPTAGWKAAVTEIEYLCFEDLTSWPQAQRTSATLPAGCGP